MNKYTRFIAPILFSASFVNAQPLNIDFGSGQPLIHQTYPAAGQVGCWNQINSFTSGVPVALGGVNGVSGACEALPGVAISASANLNAFFHLGPPNGDATLASSPEEALMDDAVIIGTTPKTLTITGLQAGQYNVIVYAGDPSSTNTRVNITVNGNDGPFSLVGGPWNHNPFIYNLGITHTIQTANLAVNQPLVITYTPVVAGAVTNGLQLVLVPEPGSLALLAVCTLALTRCRRSSQ